jgi:branched-chain amino acid transport system permease protein
MDLAATLLLQTAGAIATIVIFSAGLAVIFGMMRVINLAHGEFMMLGGYAAMLAEHHGINIWLSMLVVSPAVVGLIGMVVERVLIRRLYGRLVDSLLATWGLGLFLIGLVTAMLGNTTLGVATPLGGITIGEYRLGLYTVFLIGVAVVLVTGMYAVLRFTKPGLVARATMQDADTAATLGIDPRRVYSLTFGVGSALAGLAGGLMAPVTGVVPTMGGVFIAKAFITVICGGPAIIEGMISAAGLFGAINQIVSYLSTPVLGEAALLLAAIVLLRLLPTGISGRATGRDAV